MVEEGTVPLPHGAEEVTRLVVADAFPVGRLGGALARSRIEKTSGLSSSAIIQEEISTQKFGLRLWSLKGKLSDLELAPRGRAP
jgi:hypothetical protein